MTAKPAATTNATVNGTPAPATGTQFGLDQTVYAVSTEGLSPSAASYNNSAVITYTGNSYQFSMPANNVSLNIASGNTSGTAGNGGAVSVEFTEWTYVLGGFWVYGNNQSGLLSTYESGFLTPRTAMPISGTATYTGTNSVVGVIESVVQGKYEPVPVIGNASISVNFANNQIAGVFSNMVATTSTNQSFSWNGVTLTANISTISGNGFSGSTQATSAPANAYALKSGATGFVNGEFYGPQATEIGAVWSLYDGTTAATGVVEADGSPTPAPPTVTPPKAAGLFLNPDPYFDVGTIANPPKIDAPAPATAGTALATPVLAATAGPVPSFNGTPLPATGTVFPVTQSVMQLSNTGLTVDSAANTGGATLTIVISTPTATTFHLNIPSLGMNTPIGVSGTLGQTIAGGSLGESYVALEGLNYTSFGTWVVNPTASKADVAAFVFGYETSYGNLPRTGSATYSGTGNVVGNVYVPGQFGNVAPSVEGDATLTANFATGQLSGTFTNMRSYASNPNAPSIVYTYPWNDVSVSASITAVSTKFSGTTTTTSQPQSPLALKNGATGYINGGFYGPNAENLGAVWSLSNGDGSGTALGVVGATKQ